MIIQALKDITFPNGMKIRAVGVIEVPDAIGAALIGEGSARPRLPVGPTERKGRDPRLMPGDPLPPAIPYVRVPTDPQPAASYEPGAYEDQDNFVRDLVTLTYPFGWYGTEDWYDSNPPTPAPPVTPSDSASSRPPVLTLDQIKLHCHIESDQTAEDDILLEYEMAARLHAENYLNYLIDDTMGENIKQALLMTVAHWYRNREGVSTGRGSVGTVMPLGVKELLSMERDYPEY